MKGVYYGFIAAGVVIIGLLAAVIVLATARDGPSMDPNIGIFKQDTTICIQVLIMIIFRHIYIS